MNNAELKEKIEQMEKELAGLKNAVKENEEPKFERVIGENYYIVDSCRMSGIDITSEYDNNNGYDKSMHENNNYFHSRERAEEVADKIKMLLKLERLHDIYCPDYVPDLNNTDYYKYCIYYDAFTKRWKYINYKCTINPIDVYFSTREIAQKVCDILNAEKENEE